MQRLRANSFLTAGALAALCLSAASIAASPPRSVGVVLQEDAHPPKPWRTLTPEERTKFDLGYATFNTEWSPANSPAGRTDGLGPLFNVQSCDACHNSRRRGRGPRGDGDAPGDLVIQLGRMLPDGRIERGIPEYGRILNTNATPGFKPEASVAIRYEERPRWLIDGIKLSLRVPEYTISNLSGAPLPPDTVLMPRMPPTVQGAGLLEHVPESALLSIAKSQQRAWIVGHVSRVDAQGAIGRYGWQATEPTLASQTASAFAREMGLTSPLVSFIDCGDSDDTCRSAPNGGPVEVEPQLFNALLTFQQFHAVPIATKSDSKSPGAKLFARTGCAQCHRPALPVDLKDSTSTTIAAYTDLLLHDLGEDLADRDITGHPVRTEWRTAPLWGLNAAFATAQPQHFLHDGRARTLQEAILWHGGAATQALHQYLVLSATDRETLDAFVKQL